MEMMVRNRQVDSNISSTFSYPEPASGTTLVYTLHLPPTPPVSSRLLSTLSLIKKRPTLDATIPIADQLHFVLLSSSSGSTSTSNGNQDSTNDQSQNGGSDEVAAPYEGLRSLVHFGVTPWFESYVNSKQGKTVEISIVSGKKGAEAQTGMYDRQEKRGCYTDQLRLQVFLWPNESSPSWNFHCCIFSRTSRSLKSTWSFRLLSRKRSRP
jgi:hypothetical protein